MSLYARLSVSICSLALALGLLASPLLAMPLDPGSYGGHTQVTFYGDRDVTQQMLVVTDGEAARFLYETLGSKLGFQDLGLDSGTYVSRVVAANVACFQTRRPLQPGSPLLFIAYFCQSQLRPATGALLPELYWHYRKIIPNGVSVGN